MVLENLYLRKAISKAGYVVIVKTCQKSSRKGKLDYISPNATMLGMNIELINKGLKLTEDYIFPEDREKVIQNVIEAWNAGVESYTHEYRMVGDDGTLYNVCNEIYVEDINEESIRIEMYIKNAGNKASAPHQNNFLGTPADTRTEKTESLEDNVWFEEVMNLFAKITKLYSAFVDLDGRVVYPPVGPATNLGDFYDLFEKPEYKEYYKFIKDTAINSREAVVIERKEGGDGRICAAPIMLNGQVIGIWLLASYTREETEKLLELSEDHKKMGALLSEYAYKAQKLGVESAKSRGAGIKLREELAKQSIIVDALSKINSKLIDSVDQVIAEVLRDVGINMSLDKVMFYKVSQNPTEGFAIESCWDPTGHNYVDGELDTIPKNKYIFVHEFEENNGQYYVDSSNMTEAKKLVLMNYGFKSFIAQAIYMNDTLYGMLVFANFKSERIWTNEELRFAKSITLVIQNMIENAYGDDNIRNVNNHLIETYNNFNVGIFVRDAYTGEVLFSNRYMNNMLGYDFLHGDSRELITDLHDKFDNISGMRKPFITKNKITSWTSYIQKLDAIVDITEIKIEWLSGQPASLMILRKAKES